MWDAVCFCCNVARDRRTDNLCQADAVTPRRTTCRHKYPQAVVCATAKLVHVKGRPGWPAARACKQPLLKLRKYKNFVLGGYLDVNLKSEKREKEGGKQDNRGVLMLQVSKSDAGAYTKAMRVRLAQCVPLVMSHLFGKAIGVQSA